LVRQFNQPAAVAVKHNNPCGVAVHKEFSSALELALKSDPISVFGGIVACNREIQAADAEILNTLFLECVVAPAVSAQASAVFSKKKNLRILIWPQMLTFKDQAQFKSIAGGFLVQQPDSFHTSAKDWKFIGEKPTAEILSDLIFAERVCASLKSNSIVLVKNGVSLGMGMGQVNRVEAVEHAIHRMKTHHSGSKNLVMASDAFFPFADSIERAAAAGVNWIIQPGGSVKDEEVFTAAKKLNVNLAITGERHFRH
jgi:phosphoribosylaminoimidazolecarboxamide formyltransferase/IMP cyclohydrolase